MPNEKPIPARAVFIKFGSHRARQAAMNVWQDAGLSKPQAFYSFWRDIRKGVYSVTDDHLGALAKHGAYPYGRQWFTKLRGPFEDMHSCPSWE